MSDHANRVLVIDDDAAVRNSLAFTLGLEDLDVRTYGSGAELLADPHLPHGGCLVIDYHMPGMNGIELVRRLKQRHLSYPVILITSGTAYDLLERAAGSGIREVLEKPLQDGTLLDRIKEALAASACDQR